jgi:pSer/pThr/pTyr-binding forkhead associated (FHA) protein
VSGVKTKSLEEVEKSLQQEVKPPTTATLSGGVHEVSKASQLMQAMVGAGSEVFSDDMVLRLEVSNTPESLVIQPGNETVIGRRDPATGIAPDVDLTAYAGYRLGVSRKHAILRVRNRRLEVLDLGSSNGTSINGVRITAHEPKILRDGDQISFGKMAMRVIFQSKQLVE